MKAHLLYRDRDFDPTQAEPTHADDLVDDVELDTLLDTMAGNDGLIRSVSRTVLLTGLVDPEQIRYRQHVLDDCLHHREDVSALYQLAGDAIAAEKGVFRGFFSERPESLLHRSVEVLELFVEALKKLRRTAADLAPTFRSEGFTAFFERVSAELDDAYFAEISRHLKLMRFGGGLLVSATVGPGGETTGFVLRRPRDENKSMFNRAGLRKPTFSYTIPDRDEGGFDALSELRDRALSEVANAAAQSSDHVLSFFRALRTELAFYLGAVNAHAAVTGIGAPTCYPEPAELSTRRLSARGVYDASLCIRKRQPVVGNSVQADSADLVMVTGANQGGKSTFLRALGLAHLMMAGGMFVAAESFAASTRTGVFTHFKREEDETMSSGKFDEELARLSALIDQVRPGGLLLANESFQSTNEREGSEVARQVIHALIDSDVTVVFVTHLYDLGHSMYTELGEGREDAATVEHNGVFLRAERDQAGRRTFRVIPGEPLPTSYGDEVYDRIFAGHERTAAPSRADGHEPGTPSPLPTAPTS
jgi:hypothetical protein